jgi:hypothetical protein
MKEIIEYIIETDAAILDSCPWADMSRASINTMLAEWESLVIIGV